MSTLNPNTRSWKNCKLQEVCTLITDGTHHSPANSSSGEYPYITAKNIKKHGLDTSIDLTYVTKEIHEEIYSRCPVEFEDVLYIKDGATTGIAAMNTLKTQFSLLSSVALLKCNREILNPYFLKHWLNSPETLKTFTRKMTGTAIKRVVLKQIREAEIFLPPLAEQVRIAAKLDELLAQVDTLKARIDGIPALLKRFRHSVLAAAVSGRLTEEWRDMHGVKLAEPKSVGELAELVTKGASPKWQGIHYVEDSNQTLFVTSENVRSMNFDLTQEKYVEDKFNSLQGRSILAFGDVLTNIVGASIGRAAVWRSDRKANTNQAVCIIRTKKEALLPDYLSYYLNSPLGILSLTSEAVDVARANVSLAAVKGLQILAPELEEQTEIVRRVEQLFAFADQLEVRVKAAQARIDRLTQSILAKAFRGELVPQDPNDEPASVLLERIKAQRAAEPKVKRGRGAAKLS